jgi:hypothetical protein
MRKLFLAASAIAFSASAAQAQSSRTFPEQMDDDIVRSLPRPEVMEDMAHGVGRAAEAILDVPIGGVIRAIDPTKRVHPNETLGDIAHRDDPYARERIRDSVGGLAAGMGGRCGRAAIAATNMIAAAD